MHCVAVSRLKMDLSEVRRIEQGDPPVVSGLIVRATLGGETEHGL